MVARWKFEDSSGLSAVIPFNPKEMATPFPRKLLTTKTTTSVGGQVLLIEGPTQPAPWSFGGDVRDAANFEFLRHWTYDVPGRITITDHFGRKLVVYLEQFNPEPKVGSSRYWRHTYTVTGTIFSASAPTKDDDGYSA